MTACLDLLTGQSRLIDATVKAFADIAKGPYAQLEARAADSSEFLLAIDAFGTTKQAHDLSKGTRFQLFLALRAAA